MASVNIRTSQTSRGMFTVSPWLGDNSIYDFSALNLGNNFISSLEIVSALNAFNISRYQYHFNYYNCPQKYNPRVYLGAIQTASTYWLYDNNPGQKNSLGNLPGQAEKSGSWLSENKIFIICLK